MTDSLKDFCDCEFHQMHTMDQLAMTSMIKLQKNTTPIQSKFQLAFNIFR